jgi:hypothetical protein
LNLELYDFLKCKDRFSKKLFDNSKLMKGRHASGSELRKQLGLVPEATGASQGEEVA